MVSVSKSQAHIIIHRDVLADAGQNESGALACGLFAQDFTHDAGILFVEMADRFVGQQEIEGLDKGAHEGDALLLSETHPADDDIAFVGQSQTLEPSLDSFGRCVPGQAILDFDILPGSQFGEEPEVLEEVADVIRTDVGPLPYPESADICVVERNRAAVVMPKAEQITAKGGLSGAGHSLNEVGMSALEGDIVRPQLAMAHVTVAEDGRNYFGKSYRLHLR